MPDPVTATVGSSLLGVGMSSHAANKAEDAAADATQAEAEANAAALAFEKKKYSQWKATYGPVEKNLARYYKKLSPNSYASKNLAVFEQERSKQLTSLNESLAQKGLLSSGIASSMHLQESMNAAETRAQIKISAKDTVMGQKLDFLKSLC